MWFNDPSNTAARVEDPFFFIVAICLLLLGIITSLMILFLVKYSRKRHPRPEEVRESSLLEIVWTVVPVILVLIMFYVGWTNFEFLRTPPGNAMPVTVTGRQWSWGFTYENGAQSNVLRVPLGRPVRLILTSADVIHSFFIPQFRIKEDAVPGMKTHLWFTAEKPGTYDIFCTEYCGVAHSHMLSQLIAMPAGEFDEWYRTAALKKPGAAGIELLTAKGCLGCHSTDGSLKVGPTFKGLYDKRVTVLTQGKERVVEADEEYLKRSVLQPQADIVKGFPPIMPTIPVTEEELEGIIEYIKSLR